MNVDSATNETLHLEAHTLNVGNTAHRHMVQRPKSRISINII
jgi:hypothetical protein